MAARYKFRKFEELPGLMQSSARCAWKDAKQGDGCLYKSLAGALIERIPSTDEPMGDRPITCPWELASAGELAAEIIKAAQ